MSMTIKKATDTREGRIYSLEEPGRYDTVRVSVTSGTGLGNARQGDYAIEALRQVGWIRVATLDGAGIGSDTQAVALAAPILGFREPIR